MLPHQLIPEKIVEGAPLRLAMLGMVDGNGHPYSWSAIVNGYDPGEMSKCPYPTITDYLNLAAKDQFGFPDVKVTHIWADRPEDANRVARAALIPTVVSRPEDVIGHVDAVLIATDKGDEHVERCRPFVDAGLTIFVDKPMADKAEDLQTFSRWVGQGARILSSSCMRYCKEFSPFRASTRDLGTIRFATSTISNRWERYGIHALEGIYCILGPGFLSARNVGRAGEDVVYYRHRSGAHLVVTAIDDMHGAFGTLSLYGTHGQASAAFRDTFFAFRSQLQDFISYVRSDVRPFPFSETVELMRMLVAGVQSRNEGGRDIRLDQIYAD